jgi:Na+-translocating ferredoxin:NAD+ oxidoreductase RnfD subunit
MMPGRSNHERAERAPMNTAHDATRGRTHSASQAAASVSPETRAQRRLDPRLYQIAILSGLLLFGVTRLDFEITPASLAVTVLFALATQLVCTRFAGLPAFDPKSPMISSLSLALLLRTNSEFAMAVAAIITIASKFLLRRRGKHIFNPTNFGIVVMMLLGAGWVSPGQWGTAAFFAFLLACLGGLVVNRATRSDVTYAFLASYTGILFARALWLGQPFTIPLHALQNGAFLIFTFFMISDPRTTPDSRAGRVLFAFLVAAGATFIQFGLHRTNGLLWSLAALALAVPLIDRFLPGQRYRWGASGAPGQPSPVRDLAAALARPSQRRPGWTTSGAPFPDALASLTPAASARSPFAARRRSHS